jgi:hypothetical protein
MIAKDDKVRMSGKVGISGKAGIAKDDKVSMSGKVGISGKAGIAKDDKVCMSGKVGISGKAGMSDQACKSGLAGKLACCSVRLSGRGLN